MRPSSLVVCKLRQDGTQRRVLHCWGAGDGETRTFRPHSSETWVSTELFGILASRFSCLTTKI